MAPTANYGQRQTMELANGHRTPHKSLSIIQAAHSTYIAHHSLGTLMISAGLVYFLPGIWRAPQPGGT